MTASSASPPIGEDDLQAYVDDRIAADRRLAVESYLADNAQARAWVVAEREQRLALRSRLQAKFEEPIPMRLRIANIRADRAARLAISLRRAAGIVLLLATGAVAGWAAKDAGVTATPVVTVAVTRDAVAAHRIFVVEIAHPVEVRAGDEDHLVQWLSKRLGRSLQAPDLARFGFRLMGGRLLPAGTAAAAMLMYDDDKGTRLTVYIRAGEGGETAFQFKQDAEISTIAWLDQGFGFAVSAATARDRLLPIAEAVYRTLDAEALSRPIGG